MHGYMLGWKGSNKIKSFGSEVVEIYKDKDTAERKLATIVTWGIARPEVIKISVESAGDGTVHARLAYLRDELEKRFPMTPSELVRSDKTCEELYLEKIDNLIKGTKELINAVSDL